MFYFGDFYEKKVLKSTLLRDVDAFFSTREFVLTPAARTDLENEAELNREFLKEKLSVSKIVTAIQVHSSNIAIVSENKVLYEDTDALVSNTPNTLMLLNFADCVPIILYSKRDRAGAVVHAGWRGTQAEILKKTAEVMIKKLNINAKDIIALIGPAIGKCCFETDEDVFEKLILDKTKSDLYNRKETKYYIDLKKLNSNQLLDVGVENIDICSYCTCCMSDIFFHIGKKKV